MARLQAKNAGGTRAQGARDAKASIASRAHVR